MIALLNALFAIATATSALKTQRALALENLALRQQLAILHRNSKRPKLSRVDRAFWVALSRVWPDWRQTLLLVKPETIVGWHRKGFKLYQQITDAFPYDTAQKYVLRDRDKTYGAEFVRRVNAMQIEQVITAPRCPWQNPYCERVIGTLRRDCPDHVIVLGEQHLRRILREYLSYYHACRTHLSLDKDAPEHRPVELIGDGKVMALPRVRGLHHHYTRRAA